MPIINIEYDDKVVLEEEIHMLCNGIQQIVSAAVPHSGVPVYAHCSKIKIQHAPIEINIQVSAEKVSDIDKLMSELKQKIVDWKSENLYTHPINLTLVPVNWKFEIGI